MTNGVMAKFNMNGVAKKEAKPKRGFKKTKVCSAIVGKFYFFSQ